MTSFPLGTASLRPLRIGEVLDKAIATVAGHLAQYLLICLCYSVPAVAISLGENWANHGAFAALFNGTSSGSDFPPLTWWDALAVVYAFAAGPIQYAALFILSDRLSAGSPMTARDAIRVALSRLPRVYACVGIFIAILVLNAGIGVALIAIAALAPGSVFAWMFVSLVSVVMLFANVYPFLIIEFAMVAIAAEGLGVRAALVSSFRRIGFGVRFARVLAINLLACGAFLAIELGALMIGSLLTDAADHSGSLMVLVMTIGGTFSTAVTFALLTVFSRDLRVRAEGLDLDIAAARIVRPPRSRGYGAP